MCAGGRVRVFRAARACQRGANFPRCLSERVCGPRPRSAVLLARSLRSASCSSAVRSAASEGPVLTEVRSPQRRAGCLPENAVWPLRPRPHLFLRVRHGGCEPLPHCLLPARLPPTEMQAQTSRSGGGGVGEHLSQSDVIFWNRLHCNLQHDK